MWVVAIIVLFLQTYLSRAHSSSRATASTPDVTSSKIRMFGSLASVQAMESLRFQPPESSEAFLEMCCYRSNSCTRSRSDFLIAISEYSFKCSATVRLSNKPASFCWHIPICYFTCFQSVLIEWPFTTMSPESMRSAMMIVLHSVVLPEPFGPRIPNSWFGSMTRLMLRFAFISLCVIL